MSKTTNVHPIDPPQAKCIEDMIDEYTAAKRTLAAAKKTFDLIEAELTKEVGHEDEGTFTYKTDTHKVTTTGKMTRKVDPVDVWGVKAAVSEDLFNNVITFEPKLNLSLYRKLEETNPDAYRAFSTCISAKPAKTALKVELL